MASLRTPTLLLALACAPTAWAAEEPVVKVSRATAAIDVDGDLSDPGWRDAAVVDTWFETNPGDNVPPAVTNVARLTYDDRFFYVSIEMEDKDPSKIRAPYGDRDNVPGDTDYAGVILDTRNDGKTGVMFLSNPRGIQYDAVNDDTNGNEDSSPDFFWDSAARITATGWALEIRIPFSSLRYPKTDPATWRIMLYRNWPRAFRTQMFSTRLPRGGNCFVCNSRELTGLAGLPAGGNVVLAPYVTGNHLAQRDAAGRGLGDGDAGGEVGVDVKWTPTASLAVDATLNPDFSQIESDVAQIAVNERFALNFPEKRPFFLEGVELFTTPIQAVYTRTITSPRWGLRGTGKNGALAYTALLAEDGGGGSVILPRPNSSGFADQDFRSYVAVGRVRRDLGTSFVSVLASAREVKGGGHNRVIGPDFQWRPTSHDVLTGQWLLSRTVTPQRAELASEWNGQALSGQAANLWYQHARPKFNVFAEGKILTRDFRADNGFVPQAGYHHTFLEAGRTFRPTRGFLRRLRTFAYADRTAENGGGGVLNQDLSVGAGMDGRYSSFLRFWYVFGRARASDEGPLVLSRNRLNYVIQFTPSRWLSGISVEGFVGQQVDFANARLGRGARIAARGTLRPTDHLELRLNEEVRWLDVAPQPGAGHERLFTARVDRLRATYTLNARAFVRAIGQHVSTTRDPRLYTSEVSRKSAGFSGSVLLAYKLNWQTVVFAGYGDNRDFDEESDRLEKQDRQFFMKLSYAFQR